jgi:hypothetical protein
MRLLGVVLVIFGVIALVYQGITFVVPRDRVDLGIFKITVSETRSIPLPPIVGGLALVGGIVLIGLSRRGGV